MEMIWLVALNDRVWLLCFLARFSMILSGIQLVICARTDIVCFVGVMALLWLLGGCHYDVHDTDFFNCAVKLWDGCEKNYR